MRFLLYVPAFLLVVIVALAKGDQIDIRCGEKEVFTLCVPQPSCELTCDNFVKQILPCPEGCTPGCACAQSYVRHVKTGHCINPNDCYGYGEK
ncbi:hypothetical protein ILUMI_12340 [Ignelater luminosus]|uniref:TIL domain-containing protein n=1 Tax=Ignelater luminosus TaxID=2038154 RepID=A0A8K0CYT0_IGNLU|nr:hypothetical protein ILUMI_12340 [Ignelater luminosus]